MGRLGSSGHPSLWWSSLGLGEAKEQGKEIKAKHARLYALGPSPFFSSCIHLVCPCKISSNKRILLMLNQFEKYLLVPVGSRGTQCASSLATNARVTHQ